MSYFNTWHHVKIAQIIGGLSKSIPDNIVQEITDEFGRQFENDNVRFDFKRFQKAVTRQRGG